LIRRLITQTSRDGVLAADGALYLEFGIHQVDVVERLAIDAGFAWERRDDLGGIPRVGRLTR
jgi:hypothetical protein